MSQVLRRREPVDVIRRCREFAYADDSRASWSFPCNKQGKLIAPTPEARANYERLVTGKIYGREVEDLGIVEHLSVYWKDGLLLCDCGAEFKFGHYWVNICEQCGAEYNGSGQRLAPRAQWGEETGEHPADVARTGLEGSDDE